MNVEEKSRIEKYLELQVKDYRNKTEKLLYPEKSLVLKTETVGYLVNDPVVLPQKMTFKPSRVKRILMTLVFIISSAFAGYFFFRTEFWQASILVLGALIMTIFKIWDKNLNNTVELDRVGIRYNDHLYKWADILSTHILYSEHQSEGTNYESFLILELKDDRIKKLELTKIQFSDFQLDNTIKNEKVFGHYIERYKQESISAKPRNKWEKDLLKTLD